MRKDMWVHRGEVVAYRPNVVSGAFSTDGEGYRHSVWDGKRMSVADCIETGHYGLVLGASNIYGFGIDGNEHTLPSLLAEHFGFPFGNACLPEANSRNLFSILNSILARASAAPSVVLLFTGTDFSSFCYTGIADAVFGSPNLRQMKKVLEERGGRPQPGHDFERLVEFTTLWTTAATELCRRQGIPLIIGAATSFFDRSKPSEIERDCKLGEARGPGQERYFATYKRFISDFRSARLELVERLGVPLAGPGPGSDLGFIDEFHYDAEGTKALSADFTGAIESVLGEVAAQ
jgi:hypothetical protein